ncbi:MAG: NAD-dependent epimerase/dehydratase family protein [Candidatus Velthaea sp.]
MCERYIRDGHDVTGIDNFCTGNARNVAGFAGSPRFRLVEADVSAGMPALGNVGLVLHFASPASPFDYARLARETLAVNSRGTDAACELAERCGARFVYASTSEVYGEPLVHPQAEGYWGNVNSVGPRACYDEGKRFGEALVTTRARTGALDARIVRIFNTYGPRMRATDGRVVPAFVDAALNGRPFVLFGAGTQTRSFCYVDDLVEGVVRLAALESQPATPIVNLGNPEEFSVAELAALVAELAGVPLHVAREPLPPDDPTRRRPDIARAQALLDWRPRVTLREGLAKTIAHARSR